MAEIPPPLGAKTLNPHLQCLAFLFLVVESQLVFDSVMSGSPAVISSGQMLSKSGCFPSLRGVDKPRR